MVDQGQESSPDTSRTMLLSAGSTVVEIAMDHRGTADRFMASFSSMAAVGPPDHHVRISSEDDAHVLVIDGVEFHRSIHPTTSVDHLVGWCNRQAVLSRPVAVNLHAAGLVDPGTGHLVIVAGSTGAGKTTTAAAAMRAGWGYLSDELVSIEAADTAIGYPKPLTVKAGTASLLGEAIAAWSVAETQRRWYVPPTSLGGHIVWQATPHAVLFPTFEAGSGGPTITQLSRSETLLELALNCHDELDRDGRLLALLGNVAARVHGVAIVQTGLADAVPVLRELAQRAVPPVTEVHVARASAPSNAAGPCAVDGVVSIDCGDGAVLHNPATRRMVLVDTIGAAVFGLLDGSLPLDALVAELTAAFDERTDRVHGDVTALLDQLGSEGFVTAP